MGSSKSKNKKSTCGTTELYYEVEKLIMHFHKGCKVKILSGQAPPPPKPGGH